MHRGGILFFRECEKKGFRRGTRHNKSLFYGTLGHVNDETTEKIIGAAIEVHRQLGPGLLESTYEKCLAQELGLRQVRYERQKKCSLVYRGLVLDDRYRIDFLVEDEVVLEIKAVDGLSVLDLFRF